MGSIRPLRALCSTLGCLIRPEWPTYVTVSCLYPWGLMAVSHQFPGENQARNHCHQRVSVWSVLGVFLWCWLIFEVVRLVLIGVLFIDFQAPFKTNLRAFYRSISRALFKKRSRAFQDQFKSMFRNLSGAFLRDTQEHVNTNTKLVYKHFPSLSKRLPRLFQNKFKSIAWSISRA